jgi:hypothetical protein
MHGALVITGLDASVFGNKKNETMVIVAGGDGHWVKMN